MEAALAGIGIAYLPDCLTHEHITSGKLIPLMARHSPPPAGAYIIRPPGRYPARRIRVLTEILIEHFDHSAHFARRYQEQPDDNGQ
ncbi:LysR substrate-binding domain-containing protein [Serratia proteamaculans]|uniref:LysR substrate-binding domain-containing protein n=1 Tax=Serratia proteamaculans TaxID=28151 RepID=UPI001F0EB29E|nr:LysR substrate-binding domain-containing protein [Serratia proteamaculans]